MTDQLTIRIRNDYSRDQQANAGLDPLMHAHCTIWLYSTVVALTVSEYRIQRRSQDFSEGGGGVHILLHLSSLDEAAGTWGGGGVG